jgi:hypothetical protein
MFVSELGCSEADNLQDPLPSPPTPLSLAIAK